MQTAKEINHKAVRELLKYLKIKQGLEIHYYGDLPAKKNGMGSSSCFTKNGLSSLYETQD